MGFPFDTGTSPVRCGLVSDCQEELIMGDNDNSESEVPESGCGEYEVLYLDLERAFDDYSGGEAVGAV